MAIKLREYQAKAVDWIVKRRRGSRGLCVLPTGGGKTVIASETINRLVFEGNRVVFFAHRRELIKQTVNKLMASGVNVRDIGVLMGKDSWNQHAPALVASIDTWVKRSPSPADFVFIDEAHRSTSPSYKRVVDHYASGVIVGLTATPAGYLGEIYNDLYEVATPRELVELGAIVEPIVYGSDTQIDLSGVSTKQGDFDSGELERRVNTVTLVGNLLESWQRFANGRPTVCFAAGVDHSKHIVETFRAAGVAAEHLDGSMGTRERDAILARLASGETTYVSNCAVLTEGWDCPIVKCVQLARPTRSLPLYLQCCGRGLRPVPDGTIPVILDHAMAHLFHGLPCDDRRWTLRKKGEPRESTPAVHVRECSQCKGIVAAAALTCKHCGHTIERVVDVLETKNELVEIKDTKKHRWDMLVSQWVDINTRRLARNQAPLKRYWIVKAYEDAVGEKPPRTFIPPPEMYAASELEMTEEFNKLSRICDERGIAPSWARKKLEERYGGRARTVLETLLGSGMVKHELDSNHNDRYQGFR